MKNNIYVIEEFKNEIAYDKVFRKLVNIKCMNGVWSSFQNKTYQVIRPLSSTDNFGHWEKDLLFDHLKILLQSDDLLPKAWKTEEEKVSKRK